MKHTISINGTIFSGLTQASIRCRPHMNILPLYITRGELGVGGLKTLYNCQKSGGWLKPPPSPSPSAGPARYSKRNVGKKIERSVISNNEAHYFY